MSDAEADKMMRELMWTIALLVPVMCVAGGGTFFLLMWMFGA